MFIHVSIQNVNTDLKSAWRSPRSSANESGVARQAGTKYSSAGCACLKMCITRIVHSRPRTYAPNVARK